MSNVKSDIEIARTAKMQPIKSVLAKLNVSVAPDAKAGLKLTVSVSELLLLILK